MSLLRFISRSLLASYFVVDGVKAVADPRRLAPQAEPLAEKLTGFADRLLPDTLAQRLPIKPETFVRVHGAAETLGALMMATGICRRPGAALLALAYLPRLVMARPADHAADRAPLLRELALLGGVLIEARDTQGRPGAAWLNEQRRWQARQEARLARRQGSKAGRQAGTAPAVAAKASAATVRRQTKALAAALSPTES